MKSAAAARRVLVAITACQVALALVGLFFNEFAPVRGSWNPALLTFRYGLEPAYVLLSCLALWWSGSIGKNLRRYALVQLVLLIPATFFALLSFENGFVTSQSVAFWGVTLCALGMRILAPRYAVSAS